MSKRNHHHSGSVTTQAKAFVGQEAVAKAGEARERLEEAVEAAKEACVAVKQTSVKRVKAADQAVRDNPYRALGVAFGLGAVLGFLLSRRGES